MRTSSAFLAGFLAVLLVGCARNLGSSANKQQSSLEQSLKKIEVSDTMSVQASAVCNSDSAMNVLDQSIDQHAKAAADLVSKCEQLFECSATTQAAIKNWFASGATFQVGFVDFTKVDGTPLGGATQGMFLPYSSKIYLSLDLKTPREACPVLLHELTHRFDAMAFGAAPASLAVEYKAYWQQYVFIDELKTRKDKLANAVIYPPNGSLPVSSSPSVQDMKLLTRRDLLEQIVSAYRFPRDLSVMDRFDPMPAEKFVPIDTGPQQPTPTPTPAASPSPTPTVLTI